MHHLVPVPHPSWCTVPRLLSRIITEVSSHKIECCSVVGSMCVVIADFLSSPFYVCHFNQYQLLQHTRLLSNRLSTISWKAHKHVHTNLTMLNGFTLFRSQLGTQTLWNSKLNPFPCCLSVHYVELSLRWSIDLYSVNCGAVSCAFSYNLHYCNLIGFASIPGKSYENLSLFSRFLFSV